MDPHREVAMECLNCFRLVAWVAVRLLLASASPAQQAGEDDPAAIYDALKAFSLSGETMRAENVTRKRERVAMTFNGFFHLEAPLVGHVRRAVFIGEGQLVAAPPDSRFEREHIRRLLKAGAVKLDFKAAVLRFPDGSFEQLQAQLSPGGSGSADAQMLAREFGERMLRETGANLATRLMVSILNQESPGLFAAEFDSGKLGRFTFLFDPQTRIPVATFEINGDEKGLIFQHEAMWGGSRPGRPSKPWKITSGAWSSAPMSTTPCTSGITRWTWTFASRTNALPQKSAWTSKRCCRNCAQFRSRGTNRCRSATTCAGRKLCG